MQNYVTECYKGEVLRSEWEVLQRDSDILDNQ